MNIEQTRSCNTYNLIGLAKYLNCNPDQLLAFYDELLANERLLAEVNKNIITVREEYGFEKGIFGKDHHIDSLDWFAYQRILI